MDATYNFLDWWTKQMLSVPCKIISRTAKTAVIKLLTFGPRGRKPGDTMRVNIKSLESEALQPEPDTSWHAWTD